MGCHQRVPRASGNRFCKRHIDALPVELLVRILAEVPFGSHKVNLRMVCKRWQELLESAKAWSLHTCQRDELWTRHKFSVPAAKAMTNLLLIKAGTVLKDALSAGRIWINIHRLEVHCHSREGVAQLEDVVWEMPQLQLVRLGVCSSKALIGANLCFKRKDCQLHLFVNVHEGRQAIPRYKRSINDVLTRLEVVIHHGAHKDVTLNFGNLSACKVLQELDIKCVKACAFEEGPFPVLMARVMYQGPFDKLCFHEHAPLQWMLDLEADQVPGRAVLVQD